MKVVLLKDVEKLGIVGDEREVKDGYGRNYLIPQKLAVSSKDPNAKSVIEKAKTERRKIAKDILELKTMAEKLSEKTVEIEAKAGENGKLFGSVNSDDIAKELKLDKKIVSMEPIKEVGEHNVIINLGHEVKAKIKVNIKPIEAKKSKTKK